MNKTHISILPFTMYFVVNGTLYFYKGFNDVNQPKLFLLEEHSDLAFDSKGVVFKDRGTVNLKLVEKTVQALMLNRPCNMPIAEVTDETLEHLNEFDIKRERVKISQILEVYKNA